MCVCVQQRLQAEDSNGLFAFLQSWLVSQLKFMRCLLSSALQHFSVQFMTPNLHLLMCQLLKQCAQHGQTVGCNELWVERLIQKFKDAVSNRCTKDPEPVLTNHLILESAIRRHQPISVKNPGLQSFPVPVKKQTALHKHSKMLGTGEVVKDGALFSVCIKAVGHHLQKLRKLKRKPAEVDGWSDDLDRISMTSYDRMEWHGSNVATSSYIRQERRNDTYVSIQHTTSTKQVEVRVGQVQHLVSVRCKTDNEGDGEVYDVCFHVAVLKCYRPMQPINDHDLGVLYSGEAFETSQEWAFRAVVLHRDLEMRKLCYTGIPGTTAMLFTQYSIMH